MYKIKYLRKTGIQPFIILYYPIYRVSNKLHVLRVNSENHGHSKQISTKTQDEFQFLTDDKPNHKNLQKSS